MEKALSRQRILLQHLQPTSYSGSSSQSQESANFSVRPKSRVFFVRLSVLPNLSQFNVTFGFVCCIVKAFPFKGCLLSVILWLRLLIIVKEE